MSLPIASTPVLEGEEADRFWKIIERDSKIPAYFVPTLKLHKAKQLIKKYLDKK